MLEKKKFIDLFAGIGGFHVAFHQAGANCVFASEIDPYARMTYETNFRTISPSLFNQGFFAGNIAEVNPHQLPDFDILCAGFPCQPFSQAGFKKGFQDEFQNRGNMFFEINFEREAGRFFCCLIIVFPYFSPMVSEVFMIFLITFSWFLFFRCTCCICFERKGY